MHELYSVVLADDLGIEVMVCHHPKGTSKWNPIEHRLLFDAGFILSGITSSSQELDLLKKCEVIFGQALSPSIVSKPKDRGSSIYMTGVWFLDRSEQYEPPADLIQFLEAGEAPICVGFGSMTDSSSEALSKMALVPLDKEG